MSATKSRFLPAVLPVMLALALLCGCTPTGKKRYRVLNGMIHTPYTVKYEAAASYDDEIRSLLQEYYHSINPFDSTSVISRVNRNEDVAVDTIFARVFATARRIAEDTGGALDVTCAPLINLWGFGFTHDSTEVTQAVIDSIRSFVGYAKVRINDSARVVKDDPRIQLNFSALGDGCSCDLIGELLERNGVANYMVEVGGEVRTRGVNAGGKGWRIGIVTPEDDPEGINTHLQAIVSLRGTYGLATSGNYRNFYEKDGQKYGHTINPHTGYPARCDVLSATVIAPDCMQADAYATAIMVGGRDLAAQIARRHAEVAYYVIYALPGGELAAEYSPSFASFLQEENKASAGTARRDNL